jgi:integrase
MGCCRPLSDSEADRMEAHCRGPEELALIRMLRKTVYRSSEIASLRVGDLWDGRQVKDHVAVKRKHMKMQVARKPVPIGAEVKHALLCWFMQLQQSGFLKPDTPLWLSRKCKTILQGWSRKTIWRKVKEIADRAGVLGHIGCHSFRKLFCVRIYEGCNRDLMATRKAMGHKEVSSTQAYLEGIFDDADIEDLILRAA